MYKLLLCLRYLRTRYIALASIISVMLGVATMIVVNSVMAGFSSEMRDRIHGILADVIVETTSLDGTPDPERHMADIRRVAGGNIEAMTATVEVYGMMSFKYHGQWITRPITIIGINPEEKAKVGPLTDYLDSYNEVRERNTETNEMDVVRKPLRKRDAPPGWKLTSDAREHRRMWIDRQQFDTGPLHGSGSADGDPRDAAPAGDNGNPFGTSRAPEKSGAPKTGAPTGMEAPEFQEQEVPEFSVGSEGEAGSPEEPAFADGVPDFSKIQNEPPPPGVHSEMDFPGDPYEPLEGRVYIGMGLISFPFQDPKTGKVKIIKMVQPGEDVKISTVNSGRPPNAVHFTATVVDVFKSGMSEYDSSLVFCNLDHLQQMRGMVDPVTGQRAVTSIQIKLKDYDQADDLVRKLKAVFPPGLYQVRTWEQKQGPLLAAVEVESAILNVLLFLIIAVAGFGILAIFFMIVVEKTRDIGILKALGAGSNGVMSIFLTYGLGLGIVGSGVGVFLGLLFVDKINTIERWITWMTGRKVFDEKIYYFPEIPTMVNPVMVMWVAAGAMAIAVTASILPARRAARFHPVQALRYE